MNVTAGAPDLPDLRDYIRQRRATLAGFMEQAAAFAINGSVVVS